MTVFVQSNEFARPRPGQYEPPRLNMLGTVRDLTENLCIFGKSIGQPDYFQHIPITNCSA
jgi:hypothetical protein